MRSNIHPYSLRDNRWILAWELGTCRKVPIHRRISVIRETDPVHLTKWGVLTKSMTATTDLGSGNLVAENEYFAADNVGGHWQPH